MASEPTSQRSDDVFDKWLSQDNFVTPGLTCSYVRGPPLYPNLLFVSSDDQSHSVYYVASVGIWLVLTSVDDSCLSLLCNILMHRRLKWGKRTGQAVQAWLCSINLNLYAAAQEPWASCGY